MFRKSLLGLHPGRQIHSRRVGSQRSPVGVLAMHRLRMVASGDPAETWPQPLFSDPGKSTRDRGDAPRVRWNLW